MTFLPANTLPKPVDWPTFWAKGRQSEDWLVEPLLPRGRSVSLYAPAKQGKSLLALDVAARIATGQRCLDQPAGAPVHACYFDLEMTEDDAYERLVDMGYGPDSDLSRLHYYLLPSLPPLDTPAGGVAVLQIVQEHEAALCVFDTTSRVLSGEENASDTFRAFYMCTGLPLKDAGCTVLRLDHAGKDLTRGQRGSSAKADDVDLVWELTRRDGGLRLRATHRRQGWVPEFVDLVRLEEPLRHELAATSWPAGTQALAALLDGMDIPIEWGAKRVRPALRDASHQARNEVIAAAIRYRRQPPKVSPKVGDTPKSETGTPNAGHPGIVRGTPSGTPGDTQDGNRGPGSPPKGGHLSHASFPCLDCGAAVDEPGALCLSCEAAAWQRVGVLDV